MRDCSVSKFASSRNTAGRHFRLAWPDRHMAYMTPDEIAGNMLLFQVIRWLLSCIKRCRGFLGFFPQDPSAYEVPALRVVVEPEDFITREEDDV